MDAVVSGGFCRDSNALTYFGVGALRSRNVMTDI